MLEAVGLTVQTVDSGEEALERVAREVYDLLLVDWNLPHMTGLELCRALRKDPRLSTLPVLFLTANASSQDMVDAFASGGDDYVTKPFRAPELGARIFSLLRRARKALGLYAVTSSSTEISGGAATRIGGPQKPVPRLT